MSKRPVLLDLLGFQPRFAFRAQVAAEASNMADRRGAPQRSKAVAVPEALLGGATEVAVTCRAAMDRPECLLLGLADAAQPALCRPDTVLSTDDGPLFGAAAAGGLDALVFSQEGRSRSEEA